MLCVKEDATAALGAGAGDGAQIEHAVWGRKNNLGILVDERERRLERERDGARVLHFAVFYLYLRHTTAQGNKDLGRNRGEG